MISSKLMKYLQFIKQSPLLLLALVTGIVMGFYKPDLQSVWLDEIHSMNEASPMQSFRNVYLSVTTSEQIPPLYYYLLYFVFKVFGYTTLVARAFSAMGGVLCIYAIYLLGQKLFNKRTGEIAALLLSVTYFQLYYSQEVRPYIFFELFTILSFYRLMFLAETPNLKNTVYYAMFTALMIHFHFFGLFAVMAQCFLFLLLLFWAGREQRGRLFKNQLVAGFLILLFLLPLLPIFLKVLSIKEFWIPYPQKDTVYVIFFEIFGYSKHILFSILLLVIISIAFLFKKGKSLQGSMGLSTSFSIIVLISWLLITVLLPLIKSYLSPSVMISRYFILSLPAIILLAVLPLSKIKNTYLCYGIVLAISTFSVINTVTLNNYYARINKTQFREITSYIANNSNQNQKVITSLKWYYNYFLNNNKLHYSIEEASLEEYVGKLQKDSLHLESFWYTDAHGRQYNLSPDKEAFLKRHFILQDDVKLFDCWANNYQLKQQESNQETTIADLKTKENGRLKCNVENIDTPDNNIRISGWAFLENTASLNTMVKVVLIKKDTAIFTAGKRLRPDVGQFFDKRDLNYSGFEFSTDKNNLEQGEYAIGLYLTDKIQNTESYMLTDKKINISH